MAVINWNSPATLDLIAIKEKARKLERPELLDQIYPDRLIAIRDSSPSTSKERGK